MQQDYVLIGVPLLPQSTKRKRKVQLLYFRVDPAFASPSGSQSFRVCGPKTILISSLALLK